MRHTNIVRILALTLSLACLFVLPLAAQDSQDTSVAEAARRTREQKKASAKPATVITNDSLPPAPVPAGEPATSPATPPAPGSAPTTPAGAVSAQSAAPAGDDAEQKKKEIESLKQELAALQNEVDIAQRALSLDQDAYYSKPDYSNDKDGIAKLDSELADLKLKQDDLAQLKAKLAGIGFVEEPKAPAPPAQPGVPPAPIPTPE